MVLIGVCGSLGCFEVLVSYRAFHCDLFYMASLVSPADSACFMVNKHRSLLTEVRVILLLALDWSGFLSKHCYVTDSLHPVPAPESNKSG